MMAARIVGGGTQWRAHCLACDAGLNWYNDAEGTEAALRFTSRHNETCHTDEAA